MGTTADKGEYLNTTKSLLKDKINNLGGEITDETTFREYTNQLQEVYDRLPKTEYQEGSDITLENTLKGKLDFEDGIVGYGDTQQNGTPTPETPIDIEVVRGKNVLPNNATTQTVNGVTFTKYDDGSVLVNGTATANIQYDLLLASENKKISAGNYYLSGCPSGGTAETYRLVIGVNGTLYGEYGSGRAVTLSSGVLNSYIYIQNGATVTNKLYKPMLEKGSQATSYLPYNTLEVKIQNKNLCTEMEQGDVSTSTGEASSYQPTTSGFIRSKDYIPVKPSEVITVSYKNTATSSSQIVIFEYNANKTYIGFYYSNASTYTRTLGNETAYIKIRLQDTTNTLSNNTEIQVEYGNTKTSYVEHQEQIKRLSLGNFKPSKIGNYKDYFYRTNGKNLFDNSVERKNAYIGASSSDIGNAITYYNSSATYSYVNCAYVEAGKTYTLSWKQSTTPASTNLRVGAIVDNNNIILNTQNTWTSSSTSITFTPNVSGYLVLCTDINATNIQLELGNTATDYNPYGSGEWYFKAKNGYTMLKSTLGWIQAPSSVAEGTTRFYCSKSDVANLQATQSKDILSNAFMPLTWNDIYIGDTTTKNAISDYSQENSVANRIVIRIDSNYASSVSELNTFLDNNDFYAYYLLAIPTDTKITDTTMISQLEDIYNLMSYTGTTILEVDGDLPMIIKARALKGESN